ncbi:MAG TPA: alpha/beta hydrolase-fold protein [Caldimonas sp.]|jgi:S-formylglutathione hydrolase FrmB|nr:alpha/beta hydrolase-fold protein [Caldimonas sp.]HEX4233813.1 alpha/beta hydrolase-fold protein [Caldimonas sp.]
MSIKRPSGPPGRVVVLTHRSKVLAGNPLGDPTARPLHVWLPPQYDLPEFAVRRFPVLFDMVGFMGGGPSHTNWKGFGENVPERAARLVHQKKMAPVIIVFPDCFSALGGNQYINSSAVGRYADYLIDEIIPFVDASFRTLAAREHRGCFGKSSGGYGAIVHGMLYAEHWGAVADHSGDAYFDFVYGSDWPNTLDALAKYAKPKRQAGAIDVQKLATKQLAEGLDDGRVARFLAEMRRKKKLGPADGHTVMNLCMAASYDPDPKAPNGFRLPFNLETGERIEVRWRAWLAHDPIHMVRRHAKALRRLRGIYIDCGWADQYRIHYGARILSQRLAELGIVHTYEEFDDNHSDIDYRMDVSLPFLVSALGERGGR